MTKINNLFCVGRNFVEHVHELNNEVPTEPMFFMKPNHAAVWLNQAQQVLLPKQSGIIHYEIELVVHMKQAYHAHLPLSELIDSVHLGIDFTLRDVQQAAAKMGRPWLASKGFKQSAVLTAGVPYQSNEWWQSLSFSLLKNDTLVQTGSPQLMIFDLPTLLAYCDKTFGLGDNDVLFTGTPVGVGPVDTGDTFKLFLGDQLMGEFSIR